MCMLLASQGERLSVGFASPCPGDASESVGSEGQLAAAQGRGSGPGFLQSHLVRSPGPPLYRFSGSLVQQTAQLLHRATVVRFADIAAHFAESHRHRRRESHNGVPGGNFDETLRRR